MAREASSSDEDERGVGVVAALVVSLALGASTMHAESARAEGFGSSASGVLYNPSRNVELENLLVLDEKARNRKASVLTRGLSLIHISEPTRRS